MYQESFARFGTKSVSELLVISDDGRSSFEFVLYVCYVCDGCLLLSYLSVLFVHVRT